MKIRVPEVLLPSLTIWGQPVSKSRTQLHREEFRPKAPSLVMMTLKGTMLKAELYSMNSILT